MGTDQFAAVRELLDLASASEPLLLGRLADGDSGLPDLQTSITLPEIPSSYGLPDLSSVADFFSGIPSWVYIGVGVLLIYWFTNKSAKSRALDKLDAEYEKKKLTLRKSTP
jgi:hypothetical protein